MKIKSLVGTVFLFYLILMIGFNEPAFALVWTAQTSGTTNDLRGVSAVDANTAWAVGFSGTILHTTNAGTTWTTQTSGTTNILNDVSAVDANTAFVVGDGGTILHTTNAGTTWTAQTSGTTNVLIGVSAVDANTAFAVGTGGTILHTTNAGTTWTTQTSGTTGFLVGVSAVDASTAWAVGTVGTILYGTGIGIGGGIVFTMNLQAGCILTVNSATAAFGTVTPPATGIATFNFQNDGAGTLAVSADIGNSVTGGMQDATAVTILPSDMTVDATTTFDLTPGTAIMSNAGTPQLIANLQPLSSADEASNPRVGTLTAATTNLQNLPASGALTGTLTLTGGACT